MPAQFSKKVAACPEIGGNRFFPLQIADSTAAGVSETAVEPPVNGGFSVFAYCGSGGLGYALGNFLIVFVPVALKHLADAVFSLAKLCFTGYGCGCHKQVGEADALLVYVEIAVYSGADAFVWPIFLCDADAAGKVSADGVFYCPPVGRSGHGASFCL